MTFISDASTSPSMTMNQHGAWGHPIFTSKDPVAPVEGFVVRNQDGYGIINLRLLHSTDQMTTWASGDMGTSQVRDVEARGRGRINKVEIFEEGGYGITDLRFTTDTGEQTGWLVGNARISPMPHSTFSGSGVVSSGNGRVLTYDVPAGKVLVGVFGKTQGNYGLVDLKFALAPRPDAADAS